jgi:hypothetical protein
MSSIRQADNCGGFNGTTGTNTYFEAFYGMPNIQENDALIVFVNTQDATSHVVSITDNHGNTYAQIPGARVALTPNQQVGGYPEMVDVWWAQKVAQVNDPGENLTTAFSLTVTLDSSESNWGVVIVDAKGINGASIVLGNVLDTSLISADGTISGPSLNGGSGAVFLSALASFAAGSGYGNEAPSPGSSVASPWEVIVAPGITHGGGYAYVEGGYMAVASYVGAGAQQADFTIVNSSIACVCGVAFVGGSGGESIEVLQTAILSRASGTDGGVASFRDTLLGVINS